MLFVDLLLFISDIYIFIFYVYLLELAYTVIRLETLNFIFTHIFYYSFSVLSF